MKLELLLFDTVTSCLSCKFKISAMIVNLNDLDIAIRREIVYCSSTEMSHKLFFSSAGQAGVVSVS